MVCVVCVRVGRRRCITTAWQQGMQPNNSLALGTAPLHVWHGEHNAPRTLRSFCAMSAVLACPSCLQGSSRPLIDAHAKSASLSDMQTHPSRPPGLRPPPAPELHLRVGCNVLGGPHAAVHEDTGPALLLSTPCGRPCGPMRRCHGCCATCTGEWGCLTTLGAGDGAELRLRRACVKVSCRAQLARMAGHDSAPGTALPGLFVQGTC